LIPIIERRYLPPSVLSTSLIRVPDMDVLLREYYDFRKWDWSTGKPTKEKLVELGLEDAARDLW